jgi:hypothetical protein
MIITLEHEDIEAALLAWMNDKGMVADAATTSIAMSKARNSGRITAVIDPNGTPPSLAATAGGGPETVEPVEETAVDTDTVPAPNKKLFD